MSDYDQPVTVTKVHIPAMSTLGYGFGELENGTYAVVVGDHGAMAGIGQALGESASGIIVEGQILASGIAAVALWDRVAGTHS